MEFGVRIEPLLAQNLMRSTKGAYAYGESGNLEGGSPVSRCATDDPLLPNMRIRPVLIVSGDPLWHVNEVRTISRLPSSGIYLHFYRSPLISALSTNYR
jgi:hypothetical protein